MTALVWALTAAVLYGTGAALQQRQAAATPSQAAGRPRLLLLLVRRPWWLLGMVGELGGFAAHAVALRTGALTIVQMLVASSLLFSVVTVRVWSGRRLGWTAWAAVLAVIAGLASFVAVASPASGHASVPAGSGPAGLVARLVGRLSKLLGARLGADRAAGAARQALLAGRRPRAGPGPLAWHPGPAQARALTDPVGAGPQRAAQFPAAGQVTAGPRAQREELVVAGLIVVPPLYPGRRGEPVVGVGPHRGLLGIAARGPYPVGQPGQLVAAALAHRGERGRVPAQLQCDLVCAASPVAAGHRDHRQDRSINAT